MEICDLKHSYVGKNQKENLTETTLTLRQGDNVLLEVNAKICEDCLKLIQYTLTDYRDGPGYIKEASFNKLVDYKRITEAYSDALWRK
jgi:hypothetical protein